MEVNRKNGQGVLNIIRFNWHFYLIAGLLLLVFACVYSYLPNTWQTLSLVGALLGGITIVVSLIVSYYVYDYSGLYKLSFLPDLNGKVVLTLNAGFDETSWLITTKYPEIELTIADFYDPTLHTEPSIKRARKAYPPPEGCIAVNPKNLPFATGTFDYVLAILAAHEVRDEAEATAFFTELRRTLKKGGKVYVTEHLRDVNNFLAYTVGFLHFYSRARWERVFRSAGLQVRETTRTTPFIITFILGKDGGSP